MNYPASLAKFSSVCLFLASLSCSENDTPQFSYDKYTDYREGDMNYIQYYVPRNLLFFTNLEVTDQGTSLKINLTFDHTYDPSGSLKYRKGAQWITLADGQYSFELAKGNPEIISTTLTIGIFSASGKSLVVEDLTINFYPKEFYALSNYNAPGYLIIQKAGRQEIPFIKFPFAYWKAQQPTSEDIAFAKAEWGPLIESLSDPFEKARVIQLAIIRKLDPFQGVPSAELEKMSPFDQYRTLLNGEDKLWCGNWAGIYSHALACLGFTVRQVALGAVLDDSQEPVVLLAEGHRTMEVFDEKNFRWKVIDLTFYMLEARLDNKPLNVLDLQYMINNPNFVDRIRLLEYDNSRERTDWKWLKESPHAHQYFNYYKLNQKFTFLPN